MADQRPASPDDVRECALRSLLPHTYGTEEAQKAARKADERAAKLNADKLAEREVSDGQWTEHQHRSLACLMGRDELERQYLARQAQADAEPEPEPQYTAEQLAVLAAASVDPAIADPETVAAVLAAAQLSK